VLSKTGGVLGALGSALKHPAVLGAGIGGLGGAGVGYLSADKNDPNLARKMLVGGATGAAIGGLTGGLASGGGFSAEAVDSAGRSGYSVGFQEAAKKVTEDPMMAAQAVANMSAEARKAVSSVFSSSPEMAVEVLEQMSPEARKLILKRFDKGWLTRMFGG